MIDVRDERVSGWRTNKRGNRVLHIGHIVVTVFEQPKGSGWWSWCISGDEVRFSPGPFATEDEAYAAVMKEEWR